MTTPSKSTDPADAAVPTTLAADRTAVVLMAYGTPRSRDAPHFSEYSVGQYLSRVRRAAEPHGLTVTEASLRSASPEPATTESASQLVSPEHDGWPTDFAKRLPKPTVT